MKDEAWSSVKTVLNERISSPLYGAFIISWVLWNWKILYVTFFISEAKINGTKIDYILTNCSDIHYLLWLPCVSTAVIILLLPLLAYVAFVISHLFDLLKVNTKHYIQKKKYMTIAESSQLIEQIYGLEEKYSKLLIDKDKLIAQQEKKIQISEDNLGHEKRKTEEKDAIIMNLNKQHDDLVDRVNSLDTTNKNYSERLRKAKLLTPPEQLKEIEEAINFKAVELKDDYKE